MKKPILILVIATIIIASVGGFIFWQSRQNNQDGQQIIANKTPLKIALNVWPGYAYIFVAEEKGIFEKNGVNVELVLKENYNDAQKLYNDGQVDGICEVFSDTVFSGLNKPTKAVYVFDYSDEGDAIIAKNDISSLKELKGKKIGVDGFNTFSYLFVATAIKDAGLKISDVTFVNISAQRVLEALESGEIDAGHTWEPIKSEAILKGYKKLAKAGDYPGLITDILAFNQEVIAKRANDIQAMVKSLVEAREFLESDQKEAISIMAKAENMSEETMAEGLLGVHLLDKRDNEVAFTYSVGCESLYGTFQKINDIMIENKITDKILDGTNFINAGFVRHLK